MGGAHTMESGQKANSTGKVLGHPRAPFGMESGRRVHAWRGSTSRSQTTTWSPKKVTRRLAVATRPASALASANNSSKKSTPIPDANADELSEISNDISRSVG